MITVRPLLSGHPREFEKWPLNRGWPLIEVQCKLDRNGSKYESEDKSKIYCNKTSSAFPANA